MVPCQRKVRYAEKRAGITAASACRRAISACHVPAGHGCDSPPLLRWRRLQPSANRCLRACPLRHPACQAAPRRANPLAIHTTTHPSSLFLISFGPFLRFSSFTSNPVTLFLFCATEVCKSLHAITLVFKCTNTKVQLFVDNSSVRIDFIVF